MSKVTQFFHAVGAFFENNKQVAAAAAPVAANLQTAAAAAEAALPQIANAGVDAALALLGPGATAFAPLVDDYIDALIVELESRKSAAVAAPAT